MSPSSPAVIQMTATNVGAARVTWGPGTSTCQFDLFVRVDGVDLVPPPVTHREIAGSFHGRSVNGSDYRRRAVECVDEDPGT